MGKGPFRQNFDILRFKFFKEGNLSKVEYFLFDRLIRVLNDICQIYYVYPNIFINGKMMSKLHIKFICVTGVHEKSTMTSIDINTEKKILFQQ